MKYTTIKKVLTNIVIRQCDKCHHTSNQDNFSYLGDRVFSCPICASKYTSISDVIYR
jgi:Zn finger protein HypA/HybF involved in hydrogenase expression